MPSMLIVHDSHTSSREHLRDTPFVLEPSAISLLEELLEQLSEQPTAAEAAAGRNHKTIDDLHPFAPVHSCEAVL